MTRWLKYKIAMFLWRNNDWTKCVDDIENAVEELRKGDVKEITLDWKFSFLATPPKNKFSCKITLDEPDGAPCGAVRNDNAVRFY